MKVRKYFLIQSGRFLKNPHRQVTCKLPVRILSICSAFQRFGGIRGAAFGLTDLGLTGGLRGAAFFFVIFAIAVCLIFYEMHVEYNENYFGRNARN